MACRINGVNWFEIPVTNMDRAKKFYESVFGMPMSVQTKGALQMATWLKPEEATGAGGALIKIDTIKPSHDGTLVYFTVEDIQTILDRVNVNGGKTLKARTSIGEYGFIAHFEDSEGNRMGIHHWK
jgi:predicted enzyme related to lactoylglutathione lyase